MKHPQDAHTRAEQQVYEYLWQDGLPLDEVSRTITVGFGALLKMVRLSESNARINVRESLENWQLRNMRITTANNRSGRRTAS